MMTFGQYLAGLFLTFETFKLLDAESIKGLMTDWIKLLMSQVEYAPPRMQAGYKYHLSYLEQSCLSIIKAFGEALEADQHPSYKSLLTIISTDYSTTLARMTSSPMIPTSSNEFHPRSGIAFMGYFVCKGSVGLDKWSKISTYNATHPSGSDTDYVSKKKGSSTWEIKGSPNLQHAAAIGKPKKAELVLGEGRHAEDGWFAYYLDDFLTDVIKCCSVKEKSAPPTKVQGMLLSLPRIEFIDTCVPCREDSNDACSGCRKYFGYLRKLLVKSMPNGATIPILIFAYKKYESNSSDYEVHYIDKDGELQTSDVHWKPQ